MVLLTLLMIRDRQLPEEGARNRADGSLKVDREAPHRRLGVRAQTEQNAARLAQAEQDVSCKQQPTRPRIRRSYAHTHVSGQGNSKGEA